MGFLRYVSPSAYLVSELFLIFLRAETWQKNPSGGIIAPVSLYWFAWTCRPPVPWIVSVLASSLFGLSAHILFMVASDYTVSSYSTYASSAVTGQSFMREAISACLFLVGEPFYENVGYSWATCILAIIATPMAAIPFVFWRYGKWIRGRSRFAEKLKREETELQTGKVEESAKGEGAA